MGKKGLGVKELRLIHEERPTNITYQRKQSLRDKIEDVKTHLHYLKKIKTKQPRNLDHQIKHWEKELLRLRELK